MNIIKRVKIGQLLEEKAKEIERLNNMLDEFEKYLNEQMSKNVYEDEYMTCFNDKGTAYFNCLDKLKELKRR